MKRNKNKIKFVQRYVADRYMIEHVGRGEHRFSASFDDGSGEWGDLGFFKTKPEAVAACEAHLVRALESEAAIEES